MKLQELEGKTIQSVIRTQLNSVSINFTDDTCLTIECDFQGNDMNVEIYDGATWHWTDE